MRKVLVVVDMQNDFITGVLGTKEAEAIVDYVAKMIRAFPGDVVATQDTHANDYLKTEEGEHLPVVHCVEGSEGWQIENRVAKALEEKDADIIKKWTFGSKELMAHLEAMHEKEPIASFTILGICTDLCVISNAMLLKAFFREVPITVDSKGCAGVSPESHKRALEAMEVCHMTIAS